MMIFWKVSAAGNWTDGTIDVAMTLKADLTNHVDIYKGSTNNQFNMTYSANNVNHSYSPTTFNNTNWNFSVVTWSKAAEQVIYYMNGISQETDQNLGVWAGALATTTTVLGALATVAPTLFWKGYLAHAAVWTRVLSPTEIGSLLPPA